MKTYSIINQKGGVAKTTSTYNISHRLAEMGNRVLMIDLDPQASLTISTGLEPEEVGATIVDVMISFQGKKKLDIQKVIVEIDKNLHLVPSIIDLSAADNLLYNEMSREGILKRALKSIKNDYDYCFIDCPPALNQLSINALVAADFCIIPVACEYLALRGLEMLQDTIVQVQENLNPGLKIMGVIATFYNRTIHSRENLEKIQKRYNLLGIIDQTVKVKDAVYSGRPIVSYDKDSRVSQEYIEVSERIINYE